MPPSGALEAFAKANGLAFHRSGSLPAHGNLLSREGEVEGIAEGKLPGGVVGTLAHYSYTYTTTDTDGHEETHTRRFTIVVTSVPQSIGFMPVLGFRGPDSEMTGIAGDLQEMVQVDLGGHAGLKGSRCYRYKGASEMWTRRLFSPSFIDWLARSEDDLGFELADGVLTTARGGHLADAAALTGLCEEAAQVTGTIAAESDQDSNSGTAAGNAAKDPKAADRRMEAALASTEVASPRSILDAESAFRSHVFRSPGTLFRALRNAVIVTLVLNIPGMAIPIALSVQGQFAILGAIELAIVLICFFFIFRKDVRESGRRYAAEAFWRDYAAQRQLKLVEPLQFAATHAEAKLPFRPDRVMVGQLPGGGEGAFCVCGDGAKREDRVAVVAGPTGPVAEAELEAEPQGLTTKDLDTYLEQLAGEVRSASPGKAALPAASGPR